MNGKAFSVIMVLNTYKSAEKEINALNRKLDNLKQYLDRDSQDHQTSDRKAERNQNTL